MMQPLQFKLAVAITFVLGCAGAAVLWVATWAFGG